MTAGRTLAATSEALRGMMAAMMEKENVGPGQNARAQAVRIALADSMDKMMPRVLQGTVAIMAQDFTTDQLRDMLAFYRSPTGQAVLQKMPAITQQSMQLSLSQMPQMMRDFQADYCARVTCTDKERQAFAEAGAHFAQAAKVPAPTSP